MGGGLEVPRVKKGAGESSDLVSAILVDFVPELDPAYPVITAILRVVPASRWAFARLKVDGELAGLLGDTQRTPSELFTLKDEYTRQRVKAKTGSRIAATLGPLGDFESGVTLLFADAHANFGILTVLRTSELGPFTSSEISMLTLALDSTSERLASLRLHFAESVVQVQAAAGSRDDETEASEGAFYVLDSDLQIVLAWSADKRRRAALTGLRTRLADRLPAVLEETVRELIAGWRSDPATREAGIARPVPFLVVRTQPMSGPSGLFVGVRIERYRPPNSLVGPAALYHISPRELQVLALLLDGATLDEIGQTLHITSSTVQDHIKSMIDKTESRNRTELIARVLGWESSSDGKLQPK